MILPERSNVGSERGYHYLGSARIYCRMGKAFANEMLKLLGKKTGEPSKATSNDTKPPQTKAKASP